MTEYQSPDELLQPENIEYLRLTLEDVESINVNRAQYIIAYLVCFAIQAYLMITVGPDTQSPATIWLLSAVVIAGLAFFIWRFSSVLRMMGYPIWMWMPVCFLSLMPVPGLIVVVYIDRTISKTLIRGFKRQELMKEEQANDQK